jgi:hypothetical protein
MAVALSEDNSLKNNDQLHRETLKFNSIQILLTFEALFFVKTKIPKRKLSVPNSAAEKIKDMFIENAFDYLN